MLAFFTGPATTSEYPELRSLRRIFDATAVFAAVRAPSGSAPVVGSRTGPRMAPAAWRRPVGTHIQMQQEEEEVAYYFDYFDYFELEN